jgi:hypothetical protein
MGEQANWREAAAKPPVEASARERAEPRPARFSAADERPSGPFEPRTGIAQRLDLLNPEPRVASVRQDS